MSLHGKVMKKWGAGSENEADAPLQGSSSNQQEKENEYTVTKLGPAAKNLTKAAMVPFALATSKIMNNLSQDEKETIKKKDNKRTPRRPKEKNAALKTRPEGKRISESAMVSYALASAEIVNALSHEDNEKPKTKEGRIAEYHRPGTETKFERQDSLKRIALRGGEHCQSRSKKPRTMKTKPLSSTFEASIAASMLCRQLSAGRLPQYQFAAPPQQQNEMLAESSCPNSIDRIHMLMASDMSELTPSPVHKDLQHGAEKEQVLAIKAASSEEGMVPKRISHGFVDIPREASSPIKLICNGQEDCTADCASLYSC